MIFISLYENTCRTRAGEAKNKLGKCGLLMGHLTNFDEIFQIMLEPFDGKLAKLLAGQPHILKNTVGDIVEAEVLHDCPGIYGAEECL